LPGFFYIWCMSSTDLKAYEVLQRIFGEEDGQVVYQYFQDIIDEKKVKYYKEIFATKQDVAKLEAKMAENKSEILKSMFIFSVIQLLVILFFLAFFHA
jgi:hypothetical protein